MTAVDTKYQTSATSAIKTFAPKDLTGPSVVSVAGSASDGGAAISWSEASDVSGIGGYKVYRAMGTATTYAVVGTVPAATRTFSQAGLQAGTTYRYVVRAFDTKNNLAAGSSPVALATPTTGMSVTSIAATAGTPGTTTTPVTFVLTARSTSAAAVAVASAKVAFVIRNGADSIAATKSLTTTTAGTATLKLSLPLGATYSITITGVTVIGRTWDGATPPNSVSV